jgi:hypothetical protein
MRITPAAWGDFIRSTLQKVERPNGMLVGAGTGTWEDPAYLDEVIGMPGLDYVDLHIYPMAKDGALLERAFDDALAARGAGKRVTISECWLYKALPGELGSGIGNFEGIQVRDNYSFWSPRDERYVLDIMNLADATKMDFVSFFWTRYFFAYLDYSTTPRNLPAIEFNRLINQAALGNIQAGRLSLLGQYYQAQLGKR